jgi:outer membrane protein assembly factor BamB
MKKRLAAGTLILLLLAAAALLLSQRGKSARPEVFITQATGQPTITWHTMQQAWRKQPKEAANSASISQIDIHGDLAFYANKTNIYALNPRTGEQVWLRDVAQDGAHGTSNNNITVQVKPDGVGQIIVYEQIAEFVQGTLSPNVSSLIVCLNERTGKPVWKSTIDGWISSEPAISDNNLLFPLQTGEVAAVNRTTGKPAWRQLVSRKRLQLTQGMMPPRNEVKFAEGICVAHAGSSRYVRLNPDTGDKLWSSFLGMGSSMEDASQSDELSYLTVSSSGVYVLNSQYAALDPKNGKPLWTVYPNIGIALSGTYQTPVLTDNDVIFVNGSTLEAYNRRTGKPHWSREFKGARGDFGIDIRQIVWDRMDPTHRSLYIIGGTNTVIVRHRAQICAAIPNIAIEIAVDPATGSEQWRALLPELLPQRAIVYGSYVIDCDNAGVAVAEWPGPATSFPVLRGERQAIARRMLQISTDWQPGQDAFLRRLFSRLLGTASLQQSKTNISEGRAALTILELGKDSTPALTDMLESAVTTADKLNTPADELLESGLLSSAMAYICDIRDPEIEPTILHMLASKHKSGTQAVLVSILIQLNTGKAFKALFSYAQSCTDTDFSTGEAALYYICRFAPQVGAASTVTQPQITSYLMNSLTDPNAAAWIKRFACFELAHNRGQAALEAARGVVRSVPATPLMPDYAALKSSASATRGVQNTPASPVASVLCPDGRLRGLFLASHLSAADLWLADSSDGIKWEHPVLVKRSDLCSCNSSQLTVAEKTPLKLKFSGIKLENDNSDTIAVAAISKDSDGDGIPDNTEQQLGLNPNTKQTQGRPVPDTFNLVPQYQVHQLTEPEQIYSAVLSALAQYLQLTHRFKPTTPTQLSNFLNSRGCLIPCLGPSNRAVPVENSDLPIIFPRSSSDLANISFIVSGQTEAGFAKASVSKSRLVISSFWVAPGSFSVPYSISKDGNSARVRAEFSGSDRPIFEIEVRRVAGKWIPDECRLMSENRQGYARCPAPMEPQ